MLWPPWVCLLRGGGSQPGLSPRWGGVYPSQVRMGYPKGLPPIRTGRGYLTRHSSIASTPLTVCLLRSRRRTFQTVFISGLLPTGMCSKIFKAIFVIYAILTTSANNRTGNVLLFCQEISSIFVAAKVVQFSCMRFLSQLCVYVDIRTSNSPEQLPLSVHQHQ